MPHEPRDTDTAVSADIGLEDIETLTESLSESESPENAIQIRELQEQLARAQADYRNLVKRTEQERADMGRYAVASVAKKFLSMVDDLERALATVPEAIAGGEWIRGIEAMHAKLVRELGSLEIMAFDSVGSIVDERYHEALSRGPGPAGTVVSEFERWYMLGDSVLRHAKVVVGSDEISTSPETTSTPTADESDSTGK